MNEPFAIATELADQLEGELESKFQTARGEFLSKLKKALLLYVNAKYVDRVRFTSLEPHLMQIGVGGRSVNGAWGIMRKALQSLNLREDEASVVA